MESFKARWFFLERIIDAKMEYERINFIYRRKEERTGRESLRIQRRSILSGELAMAIKALTAVSLVISFLSLSRKMGRQEESSACKESPR